MGPGMGHRTLRKRSGARLMVKIVPAVFPMSITTHLVIITVTKCWIVDRDEARVYDCSLAVVTFGREQL